MHSEKNCLPLDGDRLLLASKLVEHQLSGAAAHTYTTTDKQYELAVVIKQSSPTPFPACRKPPSRPVAAWAGIAYEYPEQSRTPPARRRSDLGVAAAAAAAAATCATCAAAACAATDNATTNEDATAASVRAVTSVQQRPDRRQLAAANEAGARGMGHAVL